MTTGMWVSLTTTDVERAKAFYGALGFPLDPEFTGDDAVCVVVEENLFLMVVRRDFFATMTDKEIADPRRYAQVGINITRASREEVDAAAERALAAGGTEPQPAQDHGAMYARDVEDPDGNVLGFLHLDRTA